MLLIFPSCHEGLVAGAGSSFEGDVRSFDLLALRYRIDPRLRQLARLPRRIAGIFQTYVVCRAQADVAPSPIDLNAKHPGSRASRLDQQI